MKDHEGKSIKKKKLCAVCHKKTATHSTDHCDCQRLCKSCAAVIKLKGDQCPACHGKGLKKKVLVDSNLFHKCEQVFAAYATKLQGGQPILQGRKALLDCLHLLGYNPGKKEFRVLCSDSQHFSLDFLYKAASQLAPLNTQAIMSAFKLIDKNGDGELSMEELADTLTNFGEPLSKDEVKHMMKMFDADSSGAIDYNEFCDMLISFTKQADVQVSALRSPTHDDDDYDHDGHYDHDDHDAVDTYDKDNVQKSKMKSKIIPTTWNSRPSDLQSWDGDKLKGVFQASSGGRVLSEIYEFRLLEPSEVFVSLRSRPVGRYRRPDPNMDCRVFIAKKAKVRGTFPELVGASQLLTNEESSIRIQFDAGDYQIIPFSSGCHLKKRSENDAELDILVPTTRETDEVVLTDEALAMLNQIFDRFDYDSTGLMSENEYNMYMNFVEGETLEEGLWEVLTDFGQVNGEMTFEGFANMYKALAGEDDKEDIQKNFDALGFNKAFEPDELEPFTLYMFTKKLEVADLFVTPVDEQLTQQMDLVDILQTGTSEMIEEGLYRYTRVDTDHASIAFQNLSSHSINLLADFENSVNVITNQSTMKLNVLVPAGGASICCHVMPQRKITKWKVDCVVTVYK